MRLHVTGASGAGTTTLGRALAARLGCDAVDTDDFYWLPTEPPFIEKRPVAERLRLLDHRLRPTSWVLSGSIVSWGEPLVPAFDAVIFLSVPDDERMRRLLAREHERYGAAALAPGGSRHREHVAFIDWAARYEKGGLDVRSRALHEAWLATLHCPVIRVEGLHTVEEAVDLALGPLART